MISSNISPLDNLEDSLIDMIQCYYKNSGIIWSSMDKGLLFKLFKQYGNTGEHILFFSESVNQIILKRKKFKSNVAEGVVHGRILEFDPNATMYDGIAEDCTEGFFDSDDVPPPEFWIGMQNEKLLSFIPSELCERADVGVRNCISGCLVWISEEFKLSFP